MCRSLSGQGVDVKERDVLCTRRGQVCKLLGHVFREDSGEFGVGWGAVECPRAEFWGKGRVCARSCVRRMFGGRGVRGVLKDTPDARGSRAPRGARAQGAEGRGAEGGGVADESG